MAYFSLHVVARLSLYSLGGNRTGRIRTYINLFITMLLGGLWHGANWNFVLWGGLQGVYLAIERFLDLNKRFQGVNGVLLSWGRVFLVFLLTSVTWVFFRLLPGILLVKFLQK